MAFDIRNIFSLCILCGCFFCTPKSFAFDYKSYYNAHKQLRSFEPATDANKVSPLNRKGKKEHLLSSFTKTVLEALDNERVPVKMFDTRSNFSFYFKPAKVTKVGFKYKF
jgi:hypothetical protein